MPNVECVRCKENREGLDSPPVGGSLGESVLKQTCAPCWKEWMEMSTKIINEHRLQLFRPEHRKILEKQMREFLILPD